MVVSVARVRASLAATTLVAAIFVLSSCTTSAEVSHASSEDVITGDGTQNSQPLRTESVPAPAGGSIADVEKEASSGAVTEADMAEPIELASGLTIAVESVESVTLEAGTPGEVSGPGIAVRLTALNGSDASLDLSTAMVSVSSVTGAFGQATVNEPYSPFPASLAPGDEATGTYTFGLPADQRKSLSITVEYRAGEPIALFVGDVG